MPSGSTSSTGRGGAKKVLPPQIHERALEQFARARSHDDEPRPRLEGHDHYVFGVFLLPVAVREEDRFFYQEIDVIATPRACVTVRKTPERGYACDLGPAQLSIDRKTTNAPGSSCTSSST